jgi:hypothetical protein
MKRILIIILCFTNLIAFSQSILVNNQSVNVSSEVTFPYWLDSTSTLSIDTNVISISVLEFNIVPTQNGNSLVYVQTKVVTTVETVPNGNTWKVTGVLIDPLFTQSNNSNGGTTVISGGSSDKPVALSQESSNTMHLGEAMLYCDSLVEGGYDNWVIPKQDEVYIVAGGGGSVPGIRSSNGLWTIDHVPGGTQVGKSIGVRLDNGLQEWLVSTYDLAHVRCVRHASVTVSSGGGSSSGGSGNVVSSGLTPIAISTESPNTMYFLDALTYCDSLSEGGYSDWILPTIDELTFTVSGGVALPDSKTTNPIWSRSSAQTGSAGNVYILNLLPDNVNTSSWNYLRSQNTSSHPAWPTEVKTRCVRRGAVTVSSSGGGSSSGGSSTPSTLGNGMPTMISTESISSISFGDAILYCDSLSQSGYDDWVLPNFDQLSYAISGGCVIPDARTSEFIWSRSFMEYTGGSYVKMIKLLNNTNSSSIQKKSTYWTETSKCRCVR